MEQEMFLRKIPEDMRPWECNVNGVKYVYPAGTEQNVPAEVAALIDAYWEKQEVDYPETGISFNDLKDKPFYESTEVLFDQRVEFYEENGMGGFAGEAPEALQSLVNGETYIVTYNGIAYNCVCFNGSLGNFLIYGMEDTGEPFAIIITDDDGNGEMDMIVADYNGAASATIRIEKSVIHTIDPKFIPAGTGGGVVIVQDSAMASGVAVVSQDPTTATMNAAQIAEAVQAGKTVYFLTPTDDAALLPLAYIYLYPALVSGAMTVSALPKPYVQFGATSEIGYVSYNVNPDGSYYQASPMD